MAVIPVNFLGQPIHHSGAGLDPVDGFHVNATVFRTSDTALYNVQINALSDDPKILSNDYVRSVPPLVMNLGASGTNKRLTLVGGRFTVNLPVGLRQNSSDPVLRKIESPRDTISAHRLPPVIGCLRKQTLSVSFRQSIFVSPYPSTTYSIPSTLSTKEPFIDVKLRKRRNYFRGGRRKNLYNIRRGYSHGPLRPCNETRCGTGPESNQDCPRQGLAGNEQPRQGDRRLVEREEKRNRQSPYTVRLFPCFSIP